SRLSIWCFAAAMGSAAHFHLGAANLDVPNFTREVRPILARNCFKCHGPDDAARKSKLRLDVSDVPRKPAKSGAIAIVAGKPEESELVKRIFSTDEDEVMPPPSTKIQLSEPEKETLKRWIAA